MVKAFILKDEKGAHRIFCRRDRFKHLFELGKHKQTDSMFYSALREGDILWETKVKQTCTLFEQ